MFLKCRVIDFADLGFISQVLCGRLSLLCIHIAFVLSSVFRGFATSVLMSWCVLEVGVWGVMLCALGQRSLSKTALLKSLLRHVGYA